jgi:hypothetical protein
MVRAGSHDADPKKTHPADLFAAGFAAGLTITGLLNPYDRALYLSVANRRRFLHPSNWASPYQGIGQSLVSRVISTGLWFPLERLARDALHSHDSKNALPAAAQAALAGQMAGVVNAMLLAPLSMVKYQTWGLPDGERGAASTVRAMYRKAGLSAFFRGLAPTVARDCVFGALRQKLRSEAEQSPALRATGAPPDTLHFVADACSAGVATTLSAPLNYARNTAFATPVEQPVRGIAAALAALARETCSQPSARAGLRHLSRRLNVGWGTARVAGGMALSAFAFEHFSAAAAWARSRAGGGT